MAVNPNRIFNQFYNGQPNFMTPHIIRCGVIPSLGVYELSQGEGIDPGSKLYGVTVLRSLKPFPLKGFDFDKSEWAREERLSKCFRSLALAERHIVRLFETGGA